MNNNNFFTKLIMIALMLFASSCNKHFLDELINSTYGWQVRNDLNEGIERGVKDVPAFFINGEPVTGKPTFENLSTNIVSALKKAKKKAPVKQRA